MTNKRCYLLIVVVLLVAFCAPSVLFACPTCKDSLAGDPAAASMARAYQYSILFMMSMPFLILFGVGGYFYWEIRRARKAATLAAARQNELIATVVDMPADSAVETRELVESAT